LNRRLCGIENQSVEQGNRGLAVTALKERWLRLVAEYREARCKAQQNGTASEQLSVVDDRYRLSIDLAFGELKSAESVERLRSVLEQPGRRCN
jgi:hypothetical protein